MSEHSNNGGPFDESSNSSQPTNPAAGESNQQPSRQEQHSPYNQESSQQFVQNRTQQSPNGAENLNQQQGQQPQHNYQQVQPNQFEQASYNQASYNQQQQQQQQYYQQGQYQQNQNQYQYPPPPPPPNGYGYQQPVYMARKTNTKSIVSLILGVASIMLPYIGFFIGIAGIIVSSLSLKELKQRPEDGKGLAISGLVTSIIGTILYGLIILFVIFAVAMFSDSNNYYY